MGQDDQWIIQQCIQDGLPLPEKIANAPELLPGLEPYFEAFSRLSTCRQIGMGVGPIPWTAIVQYAALQELDQWHADMLIWCIEAMDAAYLNWSAERSKVKE